MYSDYQWEMDKKHLGDEWYLLAEYHPCGDFPVFKNRETGKILAKINGNWLDQKELYVYLLENWAPVSTDDIFFKEYKLRLWLGV